MKVQRRLRRVPKILLFACTAIAIVLACGLLVVAPATSQTAHAAGSAPCDIYGAAGTPCVSADSTVRALYSAYNGPLYQVTRASDNTTQDIGLLSPGGIANAATQDTFCANTTCTITKIYDQSPQHNDLLVEAGKSAAIANQLPITIGGKKAYGVFINAGMGYRHPVGSGVAVNGQPEGMYMVASGTHVNNGCCFDYGNVEAQIRDTGASHMDAVNLSTTCFFSSPACNGNGPWVEADLENGLFMAGSGNNPNNTGNASTFVTALLKNDGQHTFALKGGNAQSGGLTTWYNGSLPNGYQPMHQEGSIVLGTGGDGSSGSIGSFFEGVMTAGFPTDAADNSVQSNIVASGYTISSGPTLTPGSAISLRATTACCTTRYIRHQGASMVTSVISSSSSSGDKGDATWIVRNGLANGSCVSFESQDAPGQFMRQQNFVMQLQTNDGSSQFAADATFCPQAGMNGQGNSFASYDYPSRFIRHYNAIVYIASNGGPNPFDSSNVWTDDVSWVVSPPWV